MQTPKHSPSQVRILSRCLLKTETHTSALIARVALGAVILPHGLQKTTGWFGGYGFTGTMNFFTETMGIPWVFAFAAVVAESLGAFCLIVGCLSRVASLAIGITMMVAMLTTHIEYGFFMNWFGAQEGEGIEYFLLAMGLAAAVTISGGGRWSVDRLLLSPAKD